MKKFVLIPSDKYERLLKNVNNSFDDIIQVPLDQNNSEYFNSNGEQSTVKNLQESDNLKQTSIHHKELVSKEDYKDSKPVNTLKLVPPPGIPDE